MRPFKALLDRLGGGPSAPQRPPGDQGLDLLGTAFLSDPYPFYAYLRQHDPVHHTRQGSWLLTRQADIDAAFSSPVLGNAPASHAVVGARNRERFASASVAQHILPFLDKPEHTNPRRVVASAFRAALSERPPDLEAIATDLLSGLRHRAAFDAIDDYATPLSLEVISDLMGLPASDGRQLCDWAAQFFLLFAPIPTAAARDAMDAALVAFREYLNEAIGRRRVQPGDDLISRLLVVDGVDGPLSDGQIVDNCMLLLADGVENVDRGFANTLLALHRNPGEMDKLRNAPSLAGAAIAEGLRYDPPGQLVARIAREDCVLGGREIKADGVVLLAVASANRDHRAVADADSYDLSRADAPSATFGRGRHSCLGAPLVRAEMEVALRTLLARSRRFAVDDRELQWEARFGHRWLKQLPISVNWR